MNAEREKNNGEKSIKTSIYILFMKSSIKAHSKSITTNVVERTKQKKKKNRNQGKKRTSFSFRQTDELNKSL